MIKFFMCFALSIMSLPIFSNSNSLLVGTNSNHAKPLLLSKDDVSKDLIADTAGPSIALISSSGTGGTIQIVAYNFIGTSIRAWSATNAGGNCNGGGADTTDINNIPSSGSFTFTNSTTFYFGKNALSAYVDNDAAECIFIGLWDGSKTNGVNLQIRDTGCALGSGICNTGTVCKVSEVGDWAVTGINDC